MQSQTMQNKLLMKNYILDESHTCTWLSWQSQLNSHWRMVLSTIIIYFCC